VRCRVGSSIGVTVQAAARYRRVEEVHLRPIRIVSVAAGTFGLEDLGVENRGLPRLALMTGPARGRQWCVERGRVSYGPVVHDVAAGTVAEAGGRLMGRSRGAQIAVARVARARCWHMEEVRW